MSFMNIDQREQQWKGLIYGKTGTGKSSLAATAPKPVVLLSERQGFESVRESARRRGRPMPPVFFVSTKAQLGQAYSALRTPTPIVSLINAFVPAAQREEAIASLPYLVPETIVLDSMSEFFKRISDEIEETAPSRNGKDGLPVKAERYWSALADRSDALVRSFRDLPYHVLFLAGEDDRTSEDENGVSVRTVKAAAPMKALPGILASACNFVGRSIRVQDTVKSADGKATRIVHRWGVRFAAPENVETKRATGLRDVEPADVAAWFERLAAPHAQHVEKLRAEDVRPDAPPDDDATGDAPAESADAPAEQSTPEVADDGDGQPKGATRKSAQRSQTRKATT